MEEDMARRKFLQKTALAAGAVTMGDLSLVADAAAQGPARSQVFFTKDISVDGLLSIYSRINGGMTGRIGIKLHSGEPHGPNLLPIELIKGLQANVPGSTIVECNVLYNSPRKNTDTHLQTLKTNGFDFCPVEIMDADGDASLPVPTMSSEGASRYQLAPGEHLSEVAVGKGLLSYDSLLVYTHFKGHAMGGFGGSLKNIAIGCASGQVGKRQIHGADFRTGPLFLERMVEGGHAITDHFGPRIVYINVLKNLSVDCDCDAHGAAPTCRDIGIVASTDILAVDQASVDLVYAMPTDQRQDLVERIESRSGLIQLDYMKARSMGRDQYDLVAI